MAKGSPRRLRSLHTAVALAMLVAGLSVSDSAQAGGLGVCEAPFAFEAADVNVVVLPYTYAGGPDNPLSKTAKKLPLLIQLDSLFSLIKYGSVGVTYLRGEEQICETVEAKLLGKAPGAERQVRPGHGLVVLWGTIYEEGNDIYLQSYLSFSRRGTRELVQFRVNPQKGPPIVFGGTLPSQTLTFAPRHITLDDVRSTETHYRQSAMVYDLPRAGSSRQLMVIDSENPIAYQVTEIREDGWMRMASIEDAGPSGWIPVTREWPLRQKLPELAFLDAVVGYLRYRVTEDSGGSAPAPTLTWIRNALDEYEKTSSPVSASGDVAAATGKILRGALALEAGHENDNLLTVEELFSAAAALLSYSASARNLRAVVQIYRHHEAKTLDKNAESIADDLVSAIAVNPTNANVLASLESLYALLLTTDEHVPFETDELERRLKAVQDVRAGLEHTSFR